MSAHLLYATSTIVINHFGGLMFIEYICFLHMLSYSCVSSDLFNRIHWLLVNHNLILLYLLSNKDVIRAIYINFLFLFIQFFFTEAVASVASMKATPLFVMENTNVLLVIFNTELNWIELNVQIIKNLFIHLCVIFVTYIV